MSPWAGLPTFRTSDHESASAPPLDLKIVSFLVDHVHLSTLMLWASLGHPVREMSAFSDLQSFIVPCGDTCEPWTLPAPHPTWTHLTRVSIHGWFLSKSICTIIVANVQHTSHLLFGICCRKWLLFTGLLPFAFVMHWVKCPSKIHTHPELQIWPYLERAFHK